MKLTKEAKKSLDTARGLTLDLVVRFSENELEVPTALISSMSVLMQATLDMAPSHEIGMEAIELAIDLAKSESEERPACRSSKRTRSSNECRGVQEAMGK